MKWDYAVTFAEFEDDPDLYVLKPIKYVGIEVWQVRLKFLIDLIAVNLHWFCEFFCHIMFT